MKNKTLFQKLNVKKDVLKLANKLAMDGYRKYFNTIYNKSVVENLMCNGCCHIVAVFKDYLISDDQSEYLRRIYRIDESKPRLKKLISYYQETSVIFPNYTPLIESKYLYSNVIKKQKVIDEQQNLEEYKQYVKKKNKMKNKLLENFELLADDKQNNVFTSTVYYEILNASESISRIIFGVNKNERNKECQKTKEKNSDIKKLIEQINKDEENAEEKKKQEKDGKINKKNIKDHFFNKNNITRNQNNLKNNCTKGKKNSHNKTININININNTKNNIAFTERNSSNERKYTTHFSKEKNKENSIKINHQKAKSILPVHTLCNLNGNLLTLLKTKILMKERNDKSYSGRKNHTMRKKSKHKDIFMKSNQGSMNNSKTKYDTLKKSNKLISKLILKNLKNDLRKSIKKQKLNNNVNNFHHIKNKSINFIINNGSLTSRAKNISKNKIDTNPLLTISPFKRKKNIFGIFEINNYLSKTNKNIEKMNKKKYINVNTENNNSTFRQKRRNNSVFGGSYQRKKMINSKESFSKFNFN